jgi:hypothetical protein
LTASHSKGHCHHANCAITERSYPLVPNPSG